MTPRAPRLQLHPDPSSYLDATWWPESADLATELPDLITALQLRAGPIWRVVYDPALWSPTERDLVLDERVIRLDPYPFEMFGTVYVCGTNGSVVVIQAVPFAAPGPQPRPITDHAAMGAAPAH
ncbi:DUF5994 family protein [Nocardia sp. NPDC057227]|uniref:DUF5994 family protein n=1 Tax=Nocardia sp. NPDC057227 TaxID=3346056 RepID=UPI00362AD3FB